MSVCVYSIYSIDSFIHFIKQCESFFPSFFALFSLPSWFYLWFPLCSDKTNYYLNVQPFVDDMCLKQKLIFDTKPKFELLWTQTEMMKSWFVTSQFVAKNFDPEWRQWANKILNLQEVVRF